MPCEVRDAFIAPPGIIMFTELKQTTKALGYF